MTSFLIAQSPNAAIAIAAAASIVGAVLGAVLGGIAQEYVRDWISARRIHKTPLPNLKGTWKATWYIEKNGSEEVYVEDQVRIETQRGIRIIGTGDEPTLGSYTLQGNFNSHGVITLTYDFRNRTIGVVGGLVLKVNATVDQCDGRWHGYTREDKLKSGRVEWKRQA